ncbi:hypothetical protein [Gillisia limnaea]|uniref:Thymidylate synthase n=1 Tax=Gillisia limnaea (strain DSM 15749 / LMG 21470 / R-8282) TaxID=865937 RepID=H2BQP2_GILLR|nr:hypothetical protein [Gillisia limnaea]EHQ04211.1 thymidylate synthase [Gillisia limnaea DSM 15749]
MISQSSDHYNFQFFHNYVIVEAKENVEVDNKIVEQNLRIVFNHFDGKDFTLISHRKNRYTVKENAYNSKLLKKVRALAIVSEDSLVREKAIAEQTHFDQSFAFFDNLEDATGWAESVFPARV